jgi:DNA-binding NarL/FixJ family response regulator
MANCRENAAAKETIVVLAVDDQPRILRSITRFLSRGGNFIVLTSETAEKALEIVSKEAVDLVLMEINLGDERMDGIECVRKMRNRGYRGTICMLTGDFSIERVFNAAIVGADDFILKRPGTVFSDEIEKVLSRKSRSKRSPIKGTDALKDSGFLKSRLKPDQIDLLTKMVRNNYGSYKDLTSELGITETAIWKRISRIKERLQLENMEQVAELMMALKFLGRVYLCDR